MWNEPVYTYIFDLLNKFTPELTPWIAQILDLSKLKNKYLKEHVTLILIHAKLAMHDLQRYFRNQINDLSDQ